jgi:mobilome CxxCx(11)CxxC protein
MSNEHLDDEADRYRVLCWDNAVHALGTSYVFQRRARTLKSRLTWVNYIGAAVPLIVGILVLTFGTFGALEVIVPIAGLVLLVQAVVNLWAVFGGWVDKLPYANTSAAANDALSARYQELGANPPVRIDELKHAYEKLQIADKSRRDQDLPQDILPVEQRMGMRYALRKFQRQCAGCGEVPKSMQPTDCDVCGNFKYSDK